MDLRNALAQIAEIRQQLARSRTFRGFRSATAAASAAMAIAAAAVQDLIVPAPAEQLYRYLALWVGVAVLSIALAAIEIVIRHRQIAQGVQRELTRVAVEQFMPCIIAGGLVTAAIVRFAPAAASLLPGLWCIMFALGILASRTVLPGAIALGGAWYLLSGLLCLVLARETHAFSPWAMGIAFGGGQLLIAGILYWNLERTHAAEEDPES